MYSKKSWNIYDSLDDSQRSIAMKLSFLVLTSDTISVDAFGRVSIRQKKRPSGDYSSRKEMMKDSWVRKQTDLTLFQLFRPFKDYGCPVHELVDVMKTKKSFLVHSTVHSSNLPDR